MERETIKAFYQGQVIDLVVKLPTEEIEKNINIDINKEEIEEENNE